MPSGRFGNFGYRLFPELSELGDERQLTGHLERGCLEKGGISLRLPEGIDYTINLNNTGSGVLLSGQARAVAIGECARCLADARVELEGELEAYYVTRRRDEELSEIDDGVILVGPDGYIDLELPIQAALVEAVPFVLLCRPDCAGICPRCGADLNTENCTCDLGAPDPGHPLAALRGLWESGALGDAGAAGAVTGAAGVAGAETGANGELARAAGDAGAAGAAGVEERKDGGALAPPISE